ncbi:MAG: PAS domain S-box protein [Chloroflexi bacterium]|nr:PAS domain S-box protein [Chloroflexota bacterium]MCC6891558.1 PAS domain S-box protein [Anaerolineae bacterium]
MIKRFGIRVSVTYGIIAALWVIFTDVSTRLLFTDNHPLGDLVTLIRDLGFVFATALILYVVLSRELKKRTQVEKQLIYERDMSPVAIVVVDEAGVITYANHAVERIVKIPPEQLIGVPYNTFLKNPTDFQDNPIPFWQFSPNRTVPSRDQIFNVQRSMMLQDGSQIFLELNATPLFDPSDTFSGFIASINDVTQRKLDDRRLRNSEESFRLLFLSNPHPMWVYNIETLSFLEVNNAAISHYGYSRDEFLTMRLTDIQPPEKLTNFFEAISQKQPVLQHFSEIQHRLKNGALIDVELSTHKIEYAGQPARLVVAQDLTARKKAEEELRLKSAALDYAANGIVITDIEGTVQWANPAFTALTGYPARDAIGRNPRDLLNSSRHEAAFFKELWTTILAGNVWHGELINRRKDGTIYTEEQTIAPVKNAAGDITHFIGIKQDITRRKQDEEVLHKLNAELEARVAERTTQLNHIKNRIESILNSNAHPIIFCRPDSRIEQVNPAFTHIIGYPLDDIILHPVRELASQEDVDILEAAFIRVVNDRQAQSIDLTVCRQNHEAFEASIMLSPVIVQQERLLGVVLSVHDITERNLMLRHAMDLSEVKSRYVSMAAHDLRNPMAVILTASDTIERYYLRLPEDKREAKFAQIRNSIKVMTEILDDVLVMGQAESGKLEFSPAPLELATFCQTLVNEAIQAASTVVHIAYTHHNLPGIVQMDAKLLRHILSNLLSNAIKYSANRNDVHFEVIGHGAQIVFRVEDFGIGIPKADQVRLFETFHRASNARHIRGTGLGLAIVNQSVEIHGGTIEFTSEEGHGTMFMVTLPSGTKTD